MGYPSIPFTVTLTDDFNLFLKKLLIFIITFDTISTVRGVWRSLVAHGWGP